MSDVGTIPAELAGLVIETLLTGVDLVFFSAAIYVLVCKRGIVSNRNGERNSFLKVVFFLTVALWTSITTHWVASVARAFNAFVYEATDPGTLAVFENLADASNIIKTALYMFEILLFDAVLTYRLFVVWNRRFYVIIPPCISYIGLCTCCVAVLHEYSQLVSGTPFTSSNVIWIDGCYSFSISINLFCTPMIAYRIWSSTRRITRLVQHSSSFGRPTAMQLVIESGLIYGTVIFISFVLYLAKTQVFQATLDITSPTVGIAWCLVIVHGSFTSSPHSIVSQNFRANRGTGNSNQPQTSDTNELDQANLSGIQDSGDKIYSFHPLKARVAPDMVSDTASAFSKSKVDVDNSVKSSPDSFQGGDERSV